MGIKSFFAGIFGAVETKTVAAIAKKMSAEEHFTAGADKIIKKIDELNKSKIGIEREISNMETKIKESHEEQSKMEGRIRFNKENGTEVYDQDYAIAFHHKSIADELTKRVEKSKDVIFAIAESVLELNDELEKIKRHLVCINLEKEKAKWGIDNSADVTYETGMTINDIDTMVLKVDTFTNYDTSMDSTNKTDLEMYKRSLA